MSTDGMCIVELVVLVYVMLFLVFRSIGLVVMTLFIRLGTSLFKQAPKMRMRK